MLTESCFCCVGTWHPLSLFFEHLFLNLWTTLWGCRAGERGSHLLPGSCPHQLSGILQSGNLKFGGVLLGSRHSTAGLAGTGGTALQQGSARRAAG